MHSANRHPRRRRGLFAGILLLLLALACNAGTFTVADDPPAPAGASSAADAAASGEAGAMAAAEESAAAVWAAEQQALETALAAAFTPEAAFAAVAAALERGYEYEPLRAAILEARLAADGHILTEAGDRLAPTGAPAGVLDLTDLSIARQSRRRSRPGQQAVDLIPASHLMRGIEAMSGSSDSGDVTSGEYRFTIIVLSLRRTGYTLDQIVEAVVLGQGIFSTPACSYLIEAGSAGAEPAVVIPRFHGTNSRLDRDDECAVSPPDADEEADVVAEPAAEESAEEVETTDAGDVAAFCAIYEQMLAEVTVEVEAYAAVAGDPNCDYCGDGYLERAEAAMEIAYDTLIAVAPAEVRPAVEYVAAQPLVRVLSSPDGVPPELEAQILVVDDFATTHCDVSFQILVDESE